MHVEQLYKLQKNEIKAMEYKRLFSGSYLLRK